MNQNNIYIKKDYLLFIYLFFHFFQIIIADCESDCIIINKKCYHSNEIAKMCASYCLPDLVTNKCYDCSGVSASDYYHIDNDTCIPGCNGGKIIYNTKQCIDNCSISSSFYDMNDTDYCYTTEDCRRDNKKIIDNQCDCEYLFSIEEDNGGKKFKHCYGNKEYCSPKHSVFNDDTKECGNCPPGSMMKFITRSGQTYITRCSGNCLPNEYIDDESGYCTDNCPLDKFIFVDINKTKHCVDNCKDYYNITETTFILENRQCTNSCTGYMYRYDNKSCLGSCPEPYYASHRWYGRVCSIRCNKGHRYYDPDSHRCQSYCSSGRYKGDNLVCTNNLTNCYIRVDDTGTTKRCYSNCAESGYPYINSTLPYTCHPNCSDYYNNTEFYHIEGEFKCMSGCPTNYYLIEGICYCFLYGIKDVEGVKTRNCYKDEDDCKRNGFTYIKGNECLDKCRPYFEVDDVSVTTNYLKKCYESVKECVNNNYYYYNTEMLKCWSICPNNMFSTIVDSEGKPIEDFSKSTCVNKCGNDYPKHTAGINVCKKECDEGEFFAIDEPNVCISNCNSSYPYIGENNECLKLCGNGKFYFTMVSGKNKCVSNCKNYGKFFVQDDPKCYDSCPTSKGYYYYNSNYKCLKSCLYDASERFYYPIQAYPQPCKRDNENKYYLEDNTIVDKCPKYIASQNSFLCVNHCGSNKVYNNYCISACPSEAPYIQKTGDEVKCISKCETGKYIVLFRNECLDSCPKGYSINTTYKICYPNCKSGEKFNIDLNKCVTACSSGYDYYEKTNIFGSTVISVCRKSCMGTNKFVKDQLDKECVSKCSENNNFITKNSNLCTNKCGSGEYFKDTGTYTGSTSSTPHIYQCLDTCPTDEGYFYVKDNGMNKKKCYEKCPDEFPFIVNKINQRFICIPSCPSSHPYYLISKKDTNKNFYYCSEFNPCSGNNNFYLNGNCVNGAGCKSNKYNFAENKTCVVECSNANPYKTYDSTATITICKNYCENQYYIDSEKNCVADCPKKENFINYDNGNKLCLAQCNDGENYYLAKQMTDYKIYNCTKFCQNNENGFHLRLTNSKECIKQCPASLYLSKNEKICYYNCTSSTNYKFTLSRECTSSCNTNYKYYYEEEKICLAKCKNNDFAVSSTVYDYLYQCTKNCPANYYIYTNSSTGQNKFCLKQCPSDKPYLYNDTCINHCPNEKKFFINESIHTGDVLQKTCLTDCPKEYPYYKVYKENNQKTYGCINNCDEGYKVINFTDRKISAILCVQGCPDKVSVYKDDYKDYIFQILEKNNKTCYSFCPPEKPYYKYNYNEDNNCYSECPEETPFTELNESEKYQCKTEKECAGSFIDYKNKKCLYTSQTKCPENVKYMTKFKYDTNKVKYICSDSCIEKYGKYLSPYGTCVQNCETDDLVKNEGLVNDPIYNKCICKHLYIINETLQMQCLKNSTTETKCKNVSSIYHIKMFNSKECVKVCNNSNVLSVSEDICYNASHICNVSDDPNDRNTHLIIKKNGQRKCECKYKFYNKTDDEYTNAEYPNLTVCLDYDSLCPRGFGRFIPETQECLKADENCPEKFSCLFVNIFCLRECPKNSVFNTTGKYYQCQEPLEYWHETDPGTGNYECLDKCLDKYPVYAPATNQCLYECQGSYYPYIYERKCYNSCNNSKLLNIENGFVEKTTTNAYGKYTCECHNPWFYNEAQKKICSDSKIEYSIKDCNNFTNPNPIPIYDRLIRSTLQCTDKCPKDFIYIFNKECYPDCEEASYYHHYVIKKKDSNECQCQNLWFYQPDNYIQCIDPNITECVVYDYEDKFFDKKYYDKKYLVNETKECVNECPTGSYIFNYVCYDKCPIYTKDNQNDHICRCNPKAGYWYEYERYNLTFLQCAADKCPGNNNESTYIREHLLQNENKCLITCKEDKDFPFSLRKVCVKECPYFTHTNNKTGELNDLCLFYDLDDPDVDTPEKFKAAANVQAMELYKNSEKTGGYLYDKFNTTLQIYAIDRNDSLKEISFKSNLTYIDFGTCFEKIMKDKNISENESILITKYDIKPDANVNIPPDISLEKTNHKNDKYLINPVEYELYSSLTNQKLDALVCEPFEMLISYPLLLSKFDKYIDGINQNEYRQKFDIGKELNKRDKEIDTFNYNNTVYTHFCKDLEINGKDLVFEDRYKYLYPNNKLLCESNCTFNNTDFELERVNCLCTYKEVFDFNRTEEEINDILNNPDFYLPVQSSTNAEIIKCLFNFTLKQAILKNEMFYCCTIMTAAQVVCVLICSITSVKDMINNIRHILNKVNIKNYFLKKNKFFKNSKLKSDNIISTTNRELNNPPKKENNGNSETEKDDNHINNTILESDDNKKSQINNEIIIDKNKIITSTNNKAEYIPPDYNFKFFKAKDQGVIKPIEKNEIPFEINPDTKYLIERRKGVDYDDDYLSGPYLPNQNILVITNEKVPKKRHDKTLVMKESNYKESNNKEILNNTKMEKASKKRNIKLFDNLNEINEKKFTTTKQTKSNLKTPRNEKDDFNPENELKLTDEGTGFFGSIRREQIFLRVSFEKYIKTKHDNFYMIFLAEIFDKIYFIKTCLFLKKFDIFCVQLSLYIFYHILLLSLLCGFFSVKIIKKIWENDNFPDLNFYLLYGLITNVIVWIIYQFFSCILDFHDRIKDMITLKYELIENQYTEDFDRDNIHDSNEGVYKEKYDELIFQIKCRIALFYVISFIFTFFFSIYLISFFSFYTGTKHRVLTAYYTSIIELLLIKIVYGTILASLRYASKVKKYKFLYNFVFTFDKYLS